MKSACFEVEGRMNLINVNLTCGCELGDRVFPKQHLWKTSADIQIPSWDDFQRSSRKYLPEKCSYSEAQHRAARTKLN